MTDQVKVAYDVDGVILDFLTPFIEAAKEVLTEDEFATWPKSPDEWTTWDPVPRDMFMKVWQQKCLCKSCNFWTELPIHPKLQYPAQAITPEFYLTSIPCHSWERALNLSKYGFPDAPILKAAKHEKKKELIRHYGITHVIEDRFDNWCMINEETEAHCFLIKRPINIATYKLSFAEFIGKDWYRTHVIENIQEFEDIVTIARTFGKTI